MKTSKLLAIVVLLFATCTKDSSDATKSGAIEKSIIGSTATDTVKIAINDLGTRTYLGMVGGLYPGGKNSPSLQYKKDLKKFANAIKPLNTAGVIDSISGKIVFIGLGGSTAGHMMRVLREMTINDTATNRFLKLVNATYGGGIASFQSIANPTDVYWDTVFNALAATSSTGDQVEILYVESEDSSQVVAFPDRPYIAKNDIEAAVRTCKTKFRNLKFVYFLGRTTTFDSFGLSQVTNREPCPYYNGWATKFAIQDQINGVPGTEYKGDTAVAPLMTWGWYQWADGTDVPRQDGFTWQPSNTKDGLHANDDGEDTLATRFKNFLMTDRFASIWYKKH
ncbi:MAG TPA: hypothetical protein VEV83_18285 [Parafilimonas sp.]|nr:hypothetical protein [Parafilimonas sp.]